MRSSISNSNFRSTRNTVMAFSVTLMLCVLAGLFLHQRFPLESWAGNLPRLASDDRTVVMEANSDQAYDLYEAYYGIGDLGKRAQEADVLILGNSKPFFAFRNEAVRAFTDRTGIKVFNLSVPYGDGVDMARAFIDRLRLSPSVMIINENHFFSSGLSPYGEETVKLGYWQALVRVLEHEISWSSRLELHRVFPRWGLGKIDGSVPVVQYRAIQNGCLAMENFDENLVPAALYPAGEEILSPDELQKAAEFIETMRSRGIKIILTSVPYGTDNRDHLDRWIRDPEKRILVAGAEEPYQKVDGSARALGLPLITIKPDGMETFDGRHLDEKSGLGFTRLFFEAFLKRPEVKSLLKEKGKL